MAANEKALVGRYIKTSMGLVYRIVAASYIWEMPVRTKWSGFYRLRVHRISLRDVKAGKQGAKRGIRIHDNFLWKKGQLWREVRTPWLGPKMRSEHEYVRREHGTLYRKGVFPG